MAGDLSDHYPEVKEEKKPIVDKIPFDSVCGQFSCSSVVMLTGWSLATQIRLTAHLINERKTNSLVS